MGTEGKIPFWEGQSYGIVPPGEKEMPHGKTKPHAPRLYSIASSRYGDEFDGKTTSLCVRRATYWDPEMKADDPAKKGICSNFLCDAKPGDKVMMTGPVGKALLLDESNPNNVHIMVATGTAIIYFCGLKGMMPGINDMLERVATSKGIEWDTFQKGLKKNGQYHVEVY